MHTNSQFSKESAHLNFVYWLYLFDVIDNISFNQENPIYDVYIYHGSDRNIHIDSYRNKANVEIEAEFPNLGIKEVMKTQDLLDDNRKQEINQRANRIVCHHIARIDFSQIVKENAKKFNLNPKEKQLKITVLV